MKQHPVMTRFPPDEYERFQRLMLARGLTSAGELLRQLAREAADQLGLAQPVKAPPGAQSLPSVRRVPQPHSQASGEAPEVLPSSTDSSDLDQGPENHPGQLDTDRAPPAAIPPEEAMAGIDDDESELLPPGPPALL